MNIMIKNKVAQAAFFIGGSMISTGNYIFIWLVTGVLMGLGFIAGGNG